MGSYKDGRVPTLSWLILGSSHFPAAELVVLDLVGL